MAHPLAGRKQSAEHIAKRTAAIRASGRYDRLGAETTARNKARAGFKHTAESKAKMSAAMLGKRYSLGAPRSLEFRRRLSEHWTGNPNHNHWVDGKGYERSSERVQAMSRIDYRIWRESVFQRDHFTCVACGQVGGELHADHILPWSTHAELRYVVGNGRTLCAGCHRRTPTYGNRASKTPLKGNDDGSRFQIHS